MVKLTKKQLSDRIVFLQKLFYVGYITEAERNFLMRPVKDGNTTWCNYKTTVENRHIEVATNYKKLHQIIIDNEFMVFEDENGNIKYNIFSEVK